ncbi:methyltransferase domain-containing protein [Sulfurovum sp. zt1-1]|uniref:Methyltransferase domain-containing protein n=1 Tax=Sulfurovum zhangzhouensis TaxID=3019067 RepID=A0ABT7QX19_9BACT|nr:methyltransferase domain-containing protein [Sulfurovum zhangzhouensis]MDM5271375.1 methyltransferase domain-containing protein [Sulfurovum zhangzhouensis]
MKQKERGKFDQNFDPLIDKFKDQIYSGIKGEWRLKLLQEDLQELYQKDPMDIWDAGCGLGQLALWFAKEGHSLTCCDISYKMLEEAKKVFKEAGVEASFEKLPAQQMAAQIAQQDLVLFHAVIEWLANPLETLNSVSGKVKPGGHLSLLFFNYHSFVYRNALRGGWCVPFVADESVWYGRGKKLTPPYPQKPEVLIEWLRKHGYEIKVQTGIRVFHDYMNKTALEDTDIDELMQLEYRFCREPVYRDMGRYIHILARKITDSR